MVLINVVIAITTASQAEKVASSILGAKPKFALDGFCTIFSLKRCDEVPLMVLKRGNNS